MPSAKELAHSMQHLLQDGFGMIVGAIIGPVLGMFATSAHDLLAAAGTHASDTGGALRGAAASFEETESDSASSVRMWMP